MFTGYLPPFLIEQARKGYFEQAEQYGMKVDAKIAKKTRAELKRQYDIIAEQKAAKEKADAEAKAKEALEKAKESSKVAKKKTAKA